VRILVTGAGGMLGSEVVEKLKLKTDQQVFGFTRADGDLRFPGAFSEVLSDFQPDYIVHAAAKVGGIQANIDGSEDFLFENLQIDTNVISSSIRAGVRNLVYVGSSCMYPKDFRQPLSEADLLKAPLEPTNEGYAISKITGSVLCEFATRQLGLNFKTIIPSNLYGPRDNFDPTSSHMLASAIRKVHEAGKAGQQVIEVWGSGSARREYTYVTDLASWLSENLESLDDFPQVMNVGHGRDYSVDEFYSVALRVLRVDAALKHDTTKPDGMKAKLMDSRIAVTRFNWEPRTPLEDGIESTYRWFLSNLDREKGK
jgi:GDP-L-fucose synthase